MCWRLGSLVLALILNLIVGVKPAESQNGVLGLFFDPRAGDCSGTLAPGATKTLYVVLTPSGSTRGGIRGAEFKIDAQAADTYLLMSEEEVVPGTLIVGVGQATSSGVTLAFAECQNNIAIPVLKFQVMNLGSGERDTAISITAKPVPSNRDFECPIAVLCDDPVFSKVCLRSGQVVLNPSHRVSCEPGTESSEWSTVKALYRR